MYLKRYIHNDGQFKVAVIDATHVGRVAFTELSPTPIALQLLTQAMAGSLLLASSIKDEGTLQLQWKGDGPMGLITVEANTAGDVRGFAAGNAAFKREKGMGLLAQAVGRGTLTVRRRTMPSQKVFQSVVSLGEGEIAMSLARYMLESQQIRAGFQVGVALDPELGVAGAGAVLIEALPSADDNLLFILEDRLSTMAPLGELFSKENGHDLLFDHLLEGMGVKCLLESGVRYHCPCSHKRTLQVVASLPLKELQEMRAEQKSFDIACSFCAKSYPCIPEDLDAIIALKNAQ